MKYVYYDHDGAVDDLTALICLLEMKNVNIEGIGVVGADSYVTPAVDASRRLIDYLAPGRRLEVAQSNSTPVHEFPREWKMSAYTFDDFPVLNQEKQPQAPLVKDSADVDIVKKLKRSAHQVTMVMTGPMTDLARALKEAPSIKDKIARVYWMGGTLDNQGNVIEPEADGTQEWNAYWDPNAVKTVLHARLPLIEVGLNSTKRVPLDQKVRDHWASLCKYPAENLIGTGYATMHPVGVTLYLWDPLTMILSHFPDLAQTKPVRVNIVTRGSASGRMYEDPNGAPVTLVTDVDVKGFYDTIDRLCRRSLKLTK